MSESICFEIRDLAFAYDDGRPVLHDINLNINEGEFLAVVGQNGSGKTTLIKHLNGLLRPVKGLVRYQGEDIRKRSVGELARSVGYVFQNPDHQIFSATTREEIAFGPRNLGLSEEEVARRTEAALERFDLAPVADHQPAVLGYGMRRKVSIAAVYAMQTPVLILDEPTTGLDFRAKVDLMSLVSKLNREGVTIILITHDMRMVAEYAPRCMVLREGRLLLHADTRAVFGQAELLRDTHIELPQISVLARRMAPFGLREDLLSVSEFCEGYDPARARSGANEGTDAGNR